MGDVPLPVLGYEGSGVVITKLGVIMQPDAIIAELKAKLANFNIPKKCVVVSELPRNPMGKVQKTLLRDQYRASFSA